jgi:predicted ester cyclase
MRNLGCVIGLSLVGLIGCQQQEPAAAPLAPPPPAAEPAAAPAPVAAVEPKKEEPKPAPLPADQKIKFYQECWADFSTKDFTKFSSCWSDDATGEQVDMAPPVSGKTDVVEKGAKQFAAAFPDVTGELELTLVNGNNIVSIALIRGTNKGPLMTPAGEMPPTNKKVGYLMAHMIEFNDAGKAKKEMVFADGGTLMGQLGKNPAPHRKLLESGWADKPVVVASGGDVEKSNLAAYAKMIESFNKHDVPGVLAGFTDDVVISDQAAPADKVGKKESQKELEEMFKGMSDMKVEPKTVWAAGDYVVGIGTWSGTNDGDMPSMKLKKTGKKVTLQFLEVDKLQGGKFKNMWLFSNGMAMANQLGLLPGPKAAKPEAKAAKPEAKAAKPEAKTSAAPKTEAPKAAAAKAEMKPASKAAAAATPAPKK